MSENEVKAEATWTPRRIAGVGIAVVALIFVFSNLGTATLFFLWFELSAPAWIMLFFLLAAGIATGFMIGRNRYRKAK